MSKLDQVDARFVPRFSRAALHTQEEELNYLGIGSTKSSSKKRWLPALDHTRTALPRLVDMQTVYYHRQWRSRAFSVTKPSARLPTRTRRKAWKLNPVVVAMKLQEQLNALPEQTHGALAAQVGISRGRVCQYLRLLDLPSDIIQYLADPANESIVKHVTERALHKLRKGDLQHVLQEFDKLLGSCSTVRVRSE